MFKKLAIEIKLIKSLVDPLCYSQSEQFCKPSQKNR